jgi:hypothetical protein
MSRLPHLLPLALVSLGALASLGASCQRTVANTPPPAPPRPPAPAAPVVTAPSLRLYFLVDLDGYLEPCGCQQRPLGGIDRIARAIESERVNAPRSALVTAGNLFFNDGALEPRMIYQERAKAESLTHILTSLNLAAFAPGPADFAMGPEAWQRLSTSVNAPALAANAGMQASRVLDVDGVKVGLVGVADFAPATGAPGPGAPVATDPVEAARAAVAAVRAQGATVVVVLASVPRRAARSIASSIDGVDFVVAAREEGPVAPPPERIGRAFLLTAPNQGKHLGVLDLYVRGDGHFQDASDTTVVAGRTRLDARITDLRDRLAQWAHDPAADRAAVESQRRRLAGLERQRAELAAPTLPTQGRFFRERAIEISPDVAKLPAVEARIAAYFRAVNEHNRVEYATLRAPAAARGAAHYVGIEACRDCHEEAYAVWAGTPHSHAYRTLEEISKNFNLSCVGCHVTGYRQPGGSEVVQNEGLRDVQCESCHGPGSAHVTARPGPTRRATITLRVPGEFCATQCHTPEHSDHFNYDQYLPRILGPGHGRPMSEADGGAPADAAPDAAR